MYTIIIVAYIIFLHQSSQLPDSEPDEVLFSYERVTIPLFFTLTLRIRVLRHYSLDLIISVSKNECVDIVIRIHRWIQVLSSEASDYINGFDFCVDGGWVGK